MKKKCFFLVLCLLAFSDFMHLHATQLGIDGRFFTINGDRNFLLEITYFTPHDVATEDPRIGDTFLQDLIEIKSRGFNCIRVYLQTGNWDWEARKSDYSIDWSIFRSFSPYVKLPNDNFDKNPEDGFKYWNRFARLLNICDSMGLIVDITILFGSTDPRGDINPVNRTQQKNLALKLVQDFSYLRNWYLDIQNEFPSNNDNRETIITELGNIRTAVKAIDNGRLCTASCSPYKEQWSRDSITIYCTNLDFFAVHEKFNSETAFDYIDNRMTTKIPVHFQEPGRRGYEKEDRNDGTYWYFNPASDFINDLQKVYGNGYKAAGWCFHNCYSGDYDSTGFYKCNRFETPKSAYMNWLPGNPDVHFTTGDERQVNTGLLFVGGRKENRTEINGQLDAVEKEVANGVQQYVPSGNSCVRVLSPNGDEIFYHYKSNPDSFLRWEKSADITQGTVTIKLFNGCDEINTLGTYDVNQGNSGIPFPDWGNYIKTNSKLNSKLYRILICLTENSLISDWSDKPFTIMGFGKNISQTYPNGYESFYSGAVEILRWNTEGEINRVKLEYSIDNGVHWLTIADSLPNVDYFEWTVPKTPSNQCLVRVGDVDGNALDTSDAPFKIISTSPPKPMLVTVTRPSMGENLVLGTPYVIRWDYSGTGAFQVRVFLYKDGRWQNDIANYVWVSDHDRGCDWNVGFSLEGIPIKTGSGYSIVVVDLNLKKIGESGVFSISNPSITVTSPQGGEIWRSGTTHDITWTNTGTIANINLDYSTDNGSAFIPIAASISNNGAYSWRIPDTKSEQCLVRVKNAVDSSISDICDGSFKITNQPLTFTVSASAGTGGTISPSGSVQVLEGDNAAFTVAPNAGYDILDLKADGKSKGAISSYTFKNVNANHTIEAVFKAKPVTYTVTVDIQTGHGWILPDWVCCYRVYTVNGGSSFSVTLAPESGYYGWFYDLSGPGGGRFNFPGDGKIIIQAVNENRYITVYFTN